MVRRFLLTGVVLVCFSCVAWGIEGPSAELGKQLFEAQSLGASGRSCATCHENGKGLDKLAAYDDAGLKKMINYCIEKALKGKPFPMESQELDSLLLYLRSLKQS